MAAPTWQSKKQKSAKHWQKLELRQLTVFIDKKKVKGTF